MKKRYLLAALFLTAQFPAVAVVDVGSPIRATPYDQYMDPVRQTFDNMRGDEASMDRVNELMRQGRNFRYSHSTTYSPASPGATATRRAGDCKDKALWLMHELQDRNVRFVIGKLDRNARRSHAWLMWEHEGRWWILDCTMQNRAIPADSVGTDEYIPHYSFTKSSTYRH